VTRADRLNTSVLRHWGQTVLVEGVELTGVLFEPVVNQTAGPGDSRRTAPELVLRTSDLADVEAGPRARVVVDGVAYTVASREPDDGGMTRLLLRKGAA